jgi:putative FmdB family regulatory protein
MPIYEYACRKCSTDFELLRRSQDRLAPAACPTCGEQRLALRMSTAAVGVGGGRAADACAAPGGGMGMGGCCGGDACGQN